MRNFLHCLSHLLIFHNCLLLLLMSIFAQYIFLDVLTNFPGMRMRTNSTGPKRACDIVVHVTWLRAVCTGLLLQKAVCVACCFACRFKRSVDGASKVLFWPRGKRLMSSEEPQRDRFSRSKFLVIWGCFIQTDRFHNAHI